MKYDAAIFDLDGTLWTAMETSKNAFNKALQDHGIDRHVELSEVEAVTGLPFDVYLKTLFPGADKAFLQKLDDYERRQIEEEGGELYKGVKEGLIMLSKKTDLYLVSNCGTWYLDAFMNFSGLESLFKKSLCHGHQGKNKTEMINDLIDHNKIKNTVYIGDAAGDFKAANESGIDFIHAKYGPHVVENTPKVAENFDEILEILMQS